MIFLFFSFYCCPLFFFFLEMRFVSLPCTTIAFVRILTRPLFSTIRWPPMIIFPFPSGKKKICHFFFTTRCILLCYLLFLFGYPRYIQPRSTHNHPSTFPPERSINSFSFSLYCLYSCLLYIYTCTRTYNFNLCA